MNAKDCIDIFNQCIDDYHIKDNVDSEFSNPFSDSRFKGLLYKKNWIDTVQWHLEDMIRAPNINEKKGMSIKRRIDHSNQERTDLVEQIDDYYIDIFSSSTLIKDAKLNTESPGWVVDRLSILCLKIFHMKEQVNRKDVDGDHNEKCLLKLCVLEDQLKDLSIAFDQLLEDYRKGNKKIKVYRQMKMYNDKTLNPVLYKKNKL
ncbi:MAG: DUF4254 domain-containing protein [Bacteroidota bacterium]|nr:DUF4254 domain-containing protein [Bacteroidota bacterium]